MSGAGESSNTMVETITTARTVTQTVLRYRSGTGGENQPDMTQAVPFRNVIRLQFGGCDDRVVIEHIAKNLVRSCVDRVQVRSPIAVDNRATTNASHLEKSRRNVRDCGCRRQTRPDDRNASRAGPPPGVDSPPPNCPQWDGPGRALRFVGRCGSVSWHYASRGPGRHHRRGWGAPGGHLRFTGHAGVDEDRRHRPG